MSLVGESVRYADGSGETKEHTNWHSLSFYGKLADVALAREKGDNVYIDGRIEQRSSPRVTAVSRGVHEIVVSQCHVIALVRSANKADSASRKDAGNGSPIVGAEIENDWPVAG